MERQLAEIYAIHNPGQAAVDKYVTPIIYILGFPGNILAFLVWIGKRMRHSSGCYLAALAVSDLMFMTLHVLFELVNVWNMAILDVPVICEMYAVFFLWSQYYSPLLVLGFTVERYISICHPFRREKLCTTRRAVIVIVLLCLLSLGLCAIQGYFLMYDYEQRICTMRKSVTDGGLESVWSIWTWVTEMLIFLLVPVVVLGVNIRVIKEARRIGREESMRSLKGTPRKNSATTLMLLAVSFYLIVTTLPVSIMYALNYSFLEGSMTMTDEEIQNDVTWQQHFAYLQARAVIQEIGLTHYACNFYIYCITGKIFRGELCKMIAFVRCKAWSKSGMLGDHTRYYSTAETTVALNACATANGRSTQSTPETSV